MMMSNSFSEGHIKKPNVAGQFYTANPDELSSQIQRFLQSAPTPKNTYDVRALIAPHAGYKYSGRIAAQGFKYVQGKDIHTVVILAPSHHFGFPGISVWVKGGYKTPLGVLHIDEDFAQELVKSDDLFIDEPRAFEAEHSLEVQLPFIQESISKEVKIVPVIMGQADLLTCQKVAESLDKIIGDRDDILIVASSDMSHFHGDKTARAMDGAAIKLIEDFDAQGLWKQCAVRKLEMCGFVPVTTVMLLAQMRGYDVKILAYGNSGDVTNDRESVVGYTSVIFFERSKGPVHKGDESLTFAHKKRLLEIARKTIQLYVREKKTLKVNEDDPRLKEVEGAFVTIHKQGQLRGCIGNIIGQQPLYVTVRDMALAAAAKDPRFNPVSEDELVDIDIEVSVLSKPYQVQDPQEIEMGVHGVIVRQGWNQGVYLPQVATETGWDRETLLSSLCAHKAGLTPDAWKDPETEIKIFTATVFSEKEFLDR